jgi:hypothetical protein
MGGGLRGPKLRTAARRIGRPRLPSQPQQSALRVREHAHRQASAYVFPDRPIPSNAPNQVASSPEDRSAFSYVPPRLLAQRRGSPSFPLIVETLMPVSSFRRAGSRARVLQRFYLSRQPAVLRLQFSDAGLRVTLTALRLFCRSVGFLRVPLRSLVGRLSFCELSLRLTQYGGVRRDPGHGVLVVVGTTLLKRGPGWLGQASANGRSSITPKRAMGCLADTSMASSTSAHSRRLKPDAGAAIATRGPSSTSVSSLFTMQSW